MAGIGDDIKAVLEELGTTATVTRFSGTVLTEKIDFENYPTHSSEFIRKFFLTATLSYDTQFQLGDPISFSGMNGIITNIAGADFEDTLVDQTAAIYRCNVRGVVKRYEETINPSTYVKELDWQVASGNPTAFYALQYENKFGFEQILHEDIQAFGKEQHVVICPTGLDVKAGDRWYPVWDSLEAYYRVTAVEDKRIGVPILTLAEDSSRDA